MNHFIIKATEPFYVEHIHFFDSSELEKFSKFKEKLKMNPYIGKQLKVPFFKEFKTNIGKIAYFLIYEELKLVFFVAYSNKKNQQQTIDSIYNKLDKFKEYVYLHYKS